MKVKGSSIAFAVIFLFIAAVLCRITGVLHYYSLTTPSMEPNYETGSLLLTSNLKKFERSSVVAYEGALKEIPNLQKAYKGSFLGRIIAMENDTLELRDGETYLNNTLQNNGYETQLSFKLNTEQISKNKNYIKSLRESKFSDNRQHLTNQGPLILFLTAREKEKMYDHEAFILMDRKIENFDFGAHSDHINKQWSQNNYGPIVIPDDHVFIMGDNRCNSLDSRYLGFTHVDKIKAVALH